MQVYYCERKKEGPPKIWGFGDGDVKIEMGLPLLSTPISVDSSTWLAMLMLNKDGWLSVADLIGC